jgi:hypothetical protein
MKDTKLSTWLFTGAGAGARPATSSHSPSNQPMGHHLLNLLVQYNSLAFFILERTEDSPSSLSPRLECSNGRQIIYQHKLGKSKYTHPIHSHSDGE